MTTPMSIYESLDREKICCVQYLFYRIFVEERLERYIPRVRRTQFEHVPEQEGLGQRNACYGRTQTRNDHDFLPIDVNVFPNWKFIKNTFGFERFNSINPLQGVEEQLPSTDENDLMRFPMIKLI